MLWNVLVPPAGFEPATPALGERLGLLRDQRECVKPCSSARVLCLARRANTAGCWQLSGLPAEHADRQSSVLRPPPLTSPGRHEQGEHELDHDVHEDAHAVMVLGLGASGS